MSIPPPTLLTLPYDIRYLIYQHLFPAGKQIYLQAQSHPKAHLKCITASHQLIPTALLLVNRRLHSEGTEYLYNTYLFNIVGRKTDCLKLYTPFLRLLERYASEGEEVNMDVFTNGRHSSTMCVSLHTGEGKKAIVRARERGVRRGIEEVKEEVEREERMRRVRKPSLVDYLVEGLGEFGGWFFVPGLVVLVAVLVGWVVMERAGGS